MLSNTLVANEIKNSAGTEIEFQRLSTDGRTTLFAKIGESPSLLHRLSIKHVESGVGLKQRRRSAVRFDLMSISGVDSVTLITDSCYIVGDFAIGGSSTLVSATNVLANLLSFCATTGSGTTVLFDGTGSGAVALLGGGL